MRRSALAALRIFALATVATPLVATPVPAGQSASSLLGEGGIEAISVSPSGEWALAIARKRDAHGLLVQRLGTLQVTSLFSSNAPILGIGWVGKHTFIAYFSIDGPRSTLVATIREIDDEISIDTEWINAPGRPVDSLPLIDGELIWAIEHEGRSSVHRVSVSDVTRYERKRPSRRDFRLGETLASIEGSAAAWIVDRSGVPRAVVRVDEGQYAILTRDVEDRDFQEIYRFDEANEAAAVYPQSLSANGRDLIVAAYNGHDTMGLFELDATTGEFGETVFIRDDVDVTGVDFDHKNGELIAAIYEVGGERRFHYFESYEGRHLENVREFFPDEGVAIVSSSAARDVLVLWVSSPTNPGTHYFHDVKTGEMNPIGEVAQGLDRSRLVDVSTVEVDSADGTRVEAFLALPNDRAENGAPLIVMPHGGPIGVRDNKDFNPIVQYFASWGFAVLQVNYRGSSGYGRRFLESGKKQWAQGIEDDIDAAVEYAIARPEIDPSRICIVGGSYGGFSALASIIRHDARYRCAASLNGATDVPLGFAEGECSDSERCLESFADIVGDPTKDRENLIEISPAYHVDQINTPVLVVYGTEDRRVDPDHSHRLLLMLELLGKEHESLEVIGAGHSFTKIEWKLVLGSLRRFLTKHLFPSREFVSDPVQDAADSMEFTELPTVAR